MGAGRNVQGEEIDYSAGIVLNKKTGDKVVKGDLLATIYTNKEDMIAVSAEKIRNATIIGNQKEDKPLIIKVIG